MSFRSPHDRFMAHVRTRGGRRPAAAVALVLALAWIAVQTGWLVDHWTSSPYGAWLTAILPLTDLWVRGIGLCVALLLLVEWLFEPGGRAAGR